MKRLNRKGFTLIELLAVIVILAVVLVVTIPSVLNAMATARKKQAQNAVATIIEYVQKNYDLCSVSGTLGTQDYDTTIFNSDCTLKTNANIIGAAGYSNTDIYSITDDLTDGQYSISAVTVGNTGKFKDVSGTLEDGITYTIQTQSGS